MIGLTYTADVYLPDAVTGDYTVLDKSGLACRLMLYARHTPGSTSERDAPDRAEHTAIRRLLWDPAYDMSERARVHIEGQDWDIQYGTMAIVRGPDGDVEYRRADLDRAANTR